MEHKMKLLIIYCCLTTSILCKEINPVNTWSYETTKIEFSFSFPKQVDGLLIFSRVNRLAPKILIEHPGPNHRFVEIREFTLFKHNLPPNAAVNNSKLHFLPISVNIENLFTTLHKVHKVNIDGYVWTIPVDDGSGGKQGYTLLRGVNDDKIIAVKIVWPRKRNE